MNGKQALEMALHGTEEEFFTSANELRKKNFGDRIHLCNILNVKSGRCDMDCSFCSQSGHHRTAVDNYPLWSRERLGDAVQCACLGANRCGMVTSSGRLGDGDVEVLAATIADLPESIRNRVCGSLGRLSPAQLALLFQAGLRRLHHNLETAERFYGNVCSTQSWRDRLNVIRMAKEMGFEVCAGGLFGLGETWEDRIDLAAVLKELVVDCVPINFLIPHHGTPMGKAEKLVPSEALRIVALYRHLLPTTSLRICGGRGHVLGGRQYEVFRAGADALMVGDYLTAKGEPYWQDLASLAGLGLEASLGFSPGKNFS